MVRLVVIAWLVVMAGRASADTVAMLPLDGEQRLEIYGQPVAAEIARALRAAGVDVVVVGARMEVPDRALLIVDGTIKAGKHDDITLSIRVRDPRDGTVLATVPAPTTSLDHLDKAAAELSARVVPSVKTQLDVLAKARAVKTKPIEHEPVPPRETAPPLPPITTTVTAHGQAASLVQLRDALGREVIAWAAMRHGPVGVTFEVLTFSVERGSVPMARARVRVEIYLSGEKRFDRVVRTDTIVGDRGSTPAELAARTAREVIAIVQPNYRRALAPAR